MPIDMEWHEPAQPSGEGMVLTHGAGGNCRMPLLMAVGEAFCASGVLVGRYDMPFRRKRATGPPSPAGAAGDRAGLREAVESVRARVSGQVYLGGQSYGGRQASMLAAEDAGLVEGLLLLSYPLHPPGRPDQMRTAHFASLRTPALFVHGSKDPFGTEEEMAAAIALIPAGTARITIAGAGHDLKRGRFDIGGAVAAFRHILGLGQSGGL